MPAPRKSCERCRAQKARCIWTEDSTACVKCRRSGHACSAPVKTTTTSSVGAAWSPALGSFSSEQQPRQLEQTTPYLDGNGGISLPLSNDASSSTSPQRETVSRPLNWLTQLPASSPEPHTISSASSLIRVLSTRAFSVPKLPSQLPFVQDTCGTGNCYLPPAEDAHVLLQEYLHDYNSKIPLYSPEALYTLFRDCYAGVANCRPLAWVLVYTTIGMTYRLRAMSVFAAPDDTEQAEWYLSKTLARLPELLVQPPCVRLVQACISIAWLLETSSRCERAPFFASTALRLASELGYNDLPTSATTTVGELEVRYVFWLAFFIESHFSFADRRTGSIRLADITTAIPATGVSSWWDPSQANCVNQSSLNIFALHCSLAVIESEAAEELFSVQSRRRPADELDVDAGIVLDKLSAWRQRNALSHTDANHIARSMYRSDIVLCVVFEAAYFRTLYQLHAARALGDWKDKVDVFSPEALQLVMRLQNRSLTDEARQFLQLTVLMPQATLSTTWYAIRPMVAAFCTVLSARNFDPVNPVVYRGHLRLCNSVLKAFDAATERLCEPKYSAIVTFCHEVMAVATKL